MCHNSKYTVMSTLHIISLPTCTCQEIGSRYPSYDGQYRDYKSTFEADKEYEPEAEFPPVDSMEFFIL